MFCGRHVPREGTEALLSWPLVDTELSQREEPTVVLIPSAGRRLIWVSGTGQGRYRDSWDKQPIFVT